MQKPILDGSMSATPSAGLRIVGPTRLYGYVVNGDDATPAEELAYIEGPYSRRYPLPAWMPVPISEENFVRFGVSSTPTLVLADRSGIVRLYHPGHMARRSCRARSKRCSENMRRTAGGTRAACRPVRPQRRAGLTSCSRGSPRSPRSRFSTECSAIFMRVSTVALPKWGVIVTLSSASSG